MEPEVLERLFGRWKRAGISVRPGATPTDIALFEARHQVTLPPDFKTFLLTANGTGRFSPIDDGLFCFWSLNEFKSLAEEFPDAACFSTPETDFLFADMIINCPAYAIRLTNNSVDATPVFAIYSDNRRYESCLASDSFASFVEKYLAEGIVL